MRKIISLSMKNVQVQMLREMKLLGIAKQVLKVYHSRNKLI